VRRVIAAVAVIVCAVVAVVAAGGPADAQQEASAQQQHQGTTPAGPQRLRHGCRRLYSRRAFARYARRAYRWRRIGRHGQRTLWRLGRCQASARSERWARGLRRHLKARRYRRQHPWEWRRSQLSPATRAMLRRLRHCETRGISYPANYRYDGHHDGAYQYSPSTWHRAGGSGLAFQASPAEQDVRTARFFPSHRGEWACSA
jgi:hypothetical protein